MTMRPHELDARNRRTAVRLGLIVVAMFGFGFTLVPLYDVFCYVTGINGKTQRVASAAPIAPIDATRSVVVEFVTNTGSELPWQFRVEQVRMTVHPGALSEAYFTVRNESTNTVTAHAIPSVAPGLAARYLVKTECFCFAQQTLRPGETRRFPVRFFIDPKLPPTVPVVTLSYTFFSSPQQTAGRIRPGEAKEPTS